jgi:hypothetical protein
MAISTERAGRRSNSSGKPVSGKTWPVVPVFVIVFVLANARQCSGGRVAREPRTLSG